MEVFHEFVEFLRKELRTDTPLSHLSILLLVCREEGVTMPEISEKLNISQATVSRSLRLLGKYREKGKMLGHDLVYTQQDLEERRRFAVFLTPKGKKLRTKIINKDFS